MLDFGGGGHLLPPATTTTPNRAFVLDFWGGVLLLAPTTPTTPTIEHGCSILGVASSCSRHHDKPCLSTVYNSAI